jgi:hypothetical protein
MPIIYLKHPDHGTKVATMDAEAEFDEQNGWKRYNLDTQLEEIAEVVEETIAAPVNTLEVKRRRKTAE